MLAFKIMNFEHVGSITFCRIYSGTVQSGMALINTTATRRSASAACTSCMPTSARDQGSLHRRHRGAVGPRRTPAPARRSRTRQAGLLEKMDFPNPVIEMSIEPKTKADQEKMGLALHAMALEDPSFRSASTRSPARPSSRAWASCTSTSRSTS
jgi:elongation factor G